MAKRRRIALRFCWAHYSLENADGICEYVDENPQRRGRKACDVTEVRMVEARRGLR